MLPTTSKTASMVIAERIRKGIEETPYWGTQNKGRREGDHKSWDSYLSRRCGFYGDPYRAGG